MEVCRNFDLFIFFFNKIGMRSDFLLDFEDWFKFEIFLEVKRCKIIEFMEILVFDEDELIYWYFFLILYFNLG